MWRVVQVTIVASNSFRRGEPLARQILLLSNWGRTWNSIGNHLSKNQRYFGEYLNLDTATPQQHLIGCGPSTWQLRLSYRPSVCRISTRTLFVSNSTFPAPFLE